MRGEMAEGDSRAKCFGGAAYCAHRASDLMSAHFVGIAAADQRCITSSERAGASCRRDEGGMDNEEQAAIKGCSNVSEVAEPKVASCSGWSARNGSHVVLVTAM